MYSLTAKILHGQNPGHSSVVDSLQAKQAMLGWLATVYVHMFMGKGFRVPGLISLLSKCDLFLSWGICLCSRGCFPETFPTIVYTLSSQSSGTRV